MQKNIAILSDFDVAQRPRPFRMIQMLKNSYHLFVIAKNCSILDGIKTFSYPADKTSKERSQEENDAIYQKCIKKDFIPLIFTKNRLYIKTILRSLPILDLIIVEDITLLPFAVEYKQKNKKTKILIDLREFYPLEYENDKRWLESFGMFFYFICERYLPQVDFAITVGEGIAKKYLETFQLKCEIFYSLPPYFDISPSPIEQKIKIVYHGFLSPDRNSHMLLDIAQELDQRFHIYILGLSNQANFLQSLQQKAPSNVSFLPPVAMQDIIPFTQQFDLGILTLTPNNFNNANAMPNKFFEYIQARLGIITTPLPSLSSFISKYHIGKMSQDFSKESLVHTINTLDTKEIKNFKISAHYASQTLNLLSNQKKILHWVDQLLT
ncbi:glycosyltransferase [Helicobacter anseris]|nr:glycosyltransferase [Helicobacter anseris]